MSFRRETLVKCRRLLVGEGLYTTHLLQVHQCCSLNINTLSKTGIPILIKCISTFCMFVCAILKPVIFRCITPDNWMLTQAFLATYMIAYSCFSLHYRNATIQHTAKCETWLSYPNHQPSIRMKKCMSRIF